MLELRTTRDFRRDLKIAVRRGLDPELLWKVVTHLRERKTLAPRYRDHALKGDYKGFRECHIQPDWLLIYRVNGDRLILVLYRTGSHSDLF